MKQVFYGLIIMLFIAVSCNDNPRTLQKKDTDQVAGADSDLLIYPDAAEQDTDQTVLADGTQPEGNIKPDANAGDKDSPKTDNTKPDSDIVTVPDVTQPDDVTEDAEIPDSSLVDAVIQDTGSPDTQTADTATPEGTVPDTVQPDVDTCVCNSGDCCDGCRFRNNTYTCRTAVGDCDAAEKCAGTAADCPVDLKKDLGSPCGDSSNTACTSPDTCDNAGSCLPNHKPENTSCDDGLFCNGQSLCGKTGQCNTVNEDVCEGTVCREKNAMCCKEGWAGDKCLTCVRFVKQTLALPIVTDGLTWNTAFQDVNDAIVSAAKAVGNGDADTCEVWVAAGTYYIWQTSPANTVELMPFVSVYGGFKGGETETAERNYTANVTILDGHKSPDSADHVLHVITGSDDAELDGFTVTGGYVLDSSSSYVYGGGLVADGVSPIIRNCTFSNHTAKGRNASATTQAGDARGGAVYILDASPEFYNCIFTGNLAEGGTGSSANDGASAYGGAVFVSGSSAKPVFERCIFSQNTAKGGAKGTISDGADGHGGAINTSSGANAVIHSSLFYKNSAVAGQTSTTGVNSYGGAIRSNNASPVITNCTFSANTAEYGGAVANLGSSQVAVVNSILWDDAGADNTELYDQSGGSSPTATYSDIETTGATYPGTGNIKADPMFKDAGNADYHLSVNISGMTASPCIDAADDAKAPATDLEGNVRVDIPQIGSHTADMGAYEFKIQ